MTKNWILLPTLLLGACVYAESPNGRFAAIDLPVQNQTTVHKTVTVNAPAGTTVILNETPIYQNVNLKRNCYFDKRIKRRVCYE